MWQRYSLSAALWEWFIVGAILLLTLGLVAWVAYRYGRYRQQVWRMAVSRLPWGTVLFDPAGKQIYQNGVADHLLTRLGSSALEQVRKAADQGQDFSSMVRGPDDLAVHIRSRLIAEQGIGTLVTLENLTRQQQQQTEQRDFLQALSHELQTPLTAIQAHLAHIANSDPADESSWRGSLQVVNEEIERLAWLTPNVLTLLKLDAGQPLRKRPHNLVEIAEEAIQDLWEKAATHNIRLQIQPEVNLPRITLDRSAWKQVFINLIDNGIKYGREGGSVTVRLRHFPSEYLISVADDGPGIAQNELPHLFSRFYRSESHAHLKGSGLGLVIVQRIVAQHSGKIYCKNNDELGRGTVFEITLPSAGTLVT